MRQGPLPQARAASTYSRAQMDRAEARVMRAKVGMLKMPMAMMALMAMMAVQSHRVDLKNILFQQ